MAHGIDMKKILLFVILFCSSVSGQGMSTRLDSLRTYVTYQVDIPTTGTDKITTAKLNSVVNRAIYVVCNDFPAYPKLDTVYIENINTSGTLNSDFLKIKSCAMMYGDSLIIYLKPMNPDTMRYLRPDEKTNKQIKDLVFAPEFYSVHGNNLFVHPKWLRTDSVQFRIEYYAMDTTLESDSSKTSIGIEYLENVIYYACSLIEEMRGNFIKAEEWRKRYGK